MTSGSLVLITGISHTVPALNLSPSPSPRGKGSTLVEIYCRRASFHWPAPPSLEGRGLGGEVERRLQTILVHMGRALRPITDGTAIALSNRSSRASSLWRIAKSRDRYTFSVKLSSYLVTEMRKMWYQSPFFAYPCLF